MNKTLTLPWLLLLASCGNQPDAQLPGNAQDDQPFAGIGEGEVIRFTGTEPFFGGEIDGDQLTWTTPENINGDRVPVTRFAGRGGLSFSGHLQGREVDLAITPAPCSDGMSDRTYPFVVTVQLGAEQFNGCGWSDAQPFDGGEG